MPHKPKILYWDIETSYSICAAFAPKVEYIPYTNILQDWSILTISYMWEGDKKPTQLKVKRLGDDKAIVQQMRKLLEQADLLVHHNGDAFDIKKFTARLIKHDLPPLPKINTIDTKKEWKKVADAGYAHLDYLTQYVGLEGKTKNVGGLWLDVLKGGKAFKEAIDKMADYNDKDVIILKKFYDKVKKYFKGLPAVHSGAVCQSCGNKHLQSRGTYTAKSGLTYRRFCCTMCGSWSREAVAISKKTNLRGL